MGAQKWCHGGVRWGGPKCPHCWSPETVFLVPGKTPSNCIWKQPLMERCVNVVLLGYPAWCRAVDRNVNMLELTGRKKTLHYSLSLLRKEKKTSKQVQKSPQKVKLPSCLSSLWGELSQRVQSSRHHCGKRSRQASISLAGEMSLCDFVIDAVASVLWKYSKGCITLEHSTNLRKKKALSSNR